MKVVKEAFIIILLIAVVIFTLGILFYNCIPNNKVVPGTIEYQTSSETTAVIQQIQDTKLSNAESKLLNQEAISDPNSTGVILASYSVGVGELTSARAHNYYRSGKSNPFADYKEDAPTDNTGNSNGSNGSSNSGSSGNSGNSTGSSASSSGKLFENSKTK